MQPKWDVSERRGSGYFKLEGANLWSQLLTRLRFLFFLLKVQRLRELLMEVIKHLHQILLKRSLSFGYAAVSAP